MKIDKATYEVLTLTLSREDMDALKEIAREWKDGITTTEGTSGEQTVGGPTDREKHALADMIIREGKPTR